jgi:hypothetical protein
LGSELAKEALRALLMLRVLLMLRALLMLRESV